MAGVENNFRVFSDIKWKQCQQYDVVFKKVAAVKASLKDEWRGGVSAKCQEDVPGQRWNRLLGMRVHSLTADEKLHCSWSGLLPDDLSLGWEWGRTG